MSMSAVAIGGSLLLVATPAGAFASDPEAPTLTPSPEAATVSESSPAEIAPLEQTASSTSIVTAAPTLDAKALAIAKQKAAAKKRAAESRKLVSTAKRYIGVRYTRGGTSPKTGFDCSGFTRYVYKKAGKTIPRTSSAQRHAGKTISRKWARPGDLVWFTDVRHVAIYAGNGYIIDAPKPGKKVAKRKLWTRHVKFIRVAS